MLPREEKYIYDWETHRGKGKWGYILLTAFVWGTLVPFVFRFINIVTHNRISLSLFSNEFLSAKYMLLWAKFIAGFFIYALIMWQLSFRKYKELKRKQEAHDLYR